MNEVHMPLWAWALLLTCITGLLAILLGTVAYFLKNLLSEFKGVKGELGTLNATMVKIDKDLSGKVGVLESQVEDIPGLEGRLRQVETDIAAIKNGGCEVAKVCKQ